MPIRTLSRACWYTVLIVCGVVATGAATLGDEEGEEKTATPVELEAVKALVGVWKAEIQVWAAGPDAKPLMFEGVETNRASGNHWVVSDFESEYMGQKMNVHSIVGYDLNKKKLVGTVVDQGPYAATMTGEYDPAKKTVVWKTRAKTPDGKPMVQQTTMTTISDKERLLVLRMPSEKPNEFVKFMQIRFTKQ